MPTALVQHALAENELILFVQVTMPPLGFRESLWSRQYHDVWLNVTQSPFPQYHNNALLPSLQNDLTALKVWVTIPHTNLFQLQEVFVVLICRGHGFVSDSPQKPQRKRRKHHCHCHKGWHGVGPMETIPAIHGVLDTHLSISRAVEHLKVTRHPPFRTILSTKAHLHTTPHQTSWFSWIKWSAFFMGNFPFGTMMLTIIPHHMCATPHHTVLTFALLLSNKS